MASLSQIVEHLGCPILTLHILCIITDDPRLHTLEFPLVLQDPFFLHSKELEIEGISVFVGHQTFTHITGVTLHTNAYTSRPMDSLSILEQFPVLERVYITLGADLYSDPISCLATLPHMQEMRLSASSRAGMSVRIPKILNFLHLPNLRLLSLRGMPTW